MRYIKIFVMSLVLLLSARLASAQGNLQVATLSTAGADCSITTSCASLTLNPNQGGVSFTTAGTFSGTVQLEGTNNGVNWSSLSSTPLAGGAAVTSVTGTGTWVASVSGLSAVRARTSALSSGSVSTTILVTLAAPVASGGGGSGTVTSVSFTGGLVSVASPTTTPALTVAGTSGGIPYFSSASTWASSTAPAANTVTLWGGAGNPPIGTATDTTTTHALFATAGAPAFRALANTDMPGVVVQTGQTNVYGAFLQDFTAGTMELPEAAGFVANANSTIGLDLTANIVHFWTNNADSLNAVTTATDTTATHVLHATAVAGVYVSSAIATGDLPTAIPIGNVGTAGLSGTAPVTISAAGAIGCATCVTSAASLTSNAVVIGGGGQASSTISADTTTTHALFATAGAPAFRALVAGDLPNVPINQVVSATGAIATIANGNNPMTINCAQTTDSQDCMNFGETSAATGGTITGQTANQAVLAATSLSNSTATPFEVAQGQITNTVPTPAAQVECSWNNASLVGRCFVISVTNTLSSANSSIFGVYGGAAGNSLEFQVDPSGTGRFTGNVLSQSGIFSGVSSTTNVTIQAGLAAASTNGTTGSLTLTGANNGNNLATNAAGAFSAQGGDELGASAATIGGDFSLRPGGTTSTTGTPGVLQISQEYLKGATVTANNLEVMTAATSQTVTDSAANPTNVIGVAIGTANPLQIQTEGQILINSSNTAIVGDSFCTGTTAAKGTDNGTGPCSAGLPLGTVVSITAKGSSSTLPLVAVGGTGGQGTPTRTAVLTSQYTNSTTTFSNVTGGNNLAFAINASTNYIGTCHLYYQAAATAGLNIEFTGPASPTAVAYGLTEPVALGTTDNSVATAFSTSLGNTIVTATTNFDAIISFGILNGVNAGTLQLLAKSSAAAQLQIQQGSFCTIQATLS